MKCVITRDVEGTICFWEAIVINKLIFNETKMWRHKARRASKGLILTNCCSVKEVCKLLGFTPRKGSKQLVEITVKKLGGGETGKTRRSK